MAGEKYQCLDCGKTYRQKKNLVKHQRYECGDRRPFCCTLCPYSSKQKAHLKLHLATKHREHLVVIGNNSPHSVHN
ncbi:zinc finger protein 775-like [Homalodisca vitripennis]|uniref:zinc finger protein 775-like n=1 Tax=Homalodisca vitripennis TaxID=197043 RepID=UPI001EEB40E7|nr:zinc finger protein 775-like [Homalodisca vitripennis]